MAKGAFKDTLVLVGVFGAIGLVGAYLYSLYQSGQIMGAVEDASAPAPGQEALAMAAMSEAHPEVGIDPQGYNHIPIQILPPAEPLDFSMMDFTGSYTKSNCADPIRTYF